MTQETFYASGKGPKSAVWLDRYQAEAVLRMWDQVSQFAIMKTCQKVPNQCAVVRKSKTDYICLQHLRDGDAFFLELTALQCGALLPLRRELEQYYGDQLENK